MPYPGQRLIIAVFALAILGAGCSTGQSAGDLSTAAPISTRWIAAPAGKFLLQGQILEKYVDSGASTSPLGSPISNEKPGPNGGRYTEFEGGAIYWTPQTGAHIISGAISRAWQFDNGGTEGPLGYPTGDQQNIPGGSEQHFQHGTITDVNDQLDVHTSPIP
jgi:uncharacterized protein with LGFP repeats